MASSSAARFIVALSELIWRCGAGIDDERCADSEQACDTRRAG